MRACSRSTRTAAAFAVALFAGTGPARAVDWGAEAVREYGGTYSIACANPSAPRARATIAGLMVELGNRRMTGTNVQISFSHFGQQEPPPGERIVALISALRGGQQLIFVVHQDRSGQSVALDGDAKVLAALARALGAKAREPWLVPAYLEPTADAKRVTIAGTAYQLTLMCKPHDCFDNNIVVLYAAATGEVYGQRVSRTRLSQFGAPSPALASDLQRLGRAEFRPGQ